MMTNTLYLSLANILIIGQANLWAVECEDGARGSE
jgi:hypothetical protein